MIRKNIFLTAGFLSLFSLTWTGCKKDDDDNKNTTPPVNAPTAVMTATVDGSSWSASGDKITGSIIGGVTNVAGVASNNSAITFSITDSYAAGDTFDIGYLSGYSAIYSEIGLIWASHVSPQCTGQLVITGIDVSNKRISGTFHFLAYRSTGNSFREIKDGVFTDVSYSTENITAGNTFSITIDGTALNPTTVKGNVTGGILDLEAIQGSKKVVLNLPVNIENGTYPLDFGDAYYYPSSGNQTNCQSGSVTIYAHDFPTSTIRGNCNFTTEPFSGPPPTYNLTNGDFIIKYQ